MNYTLPNMKFHYLAAALLAVGCATVTASTNAVAVARPLSVFVNDPNQGRDPFFPDSPRRSQTAKPRSSQPSGPSPSAIAMDVKLMLKAISGSKLQPLAMINNATIGIGEASDVRAGTRTVRIRCKEIRERSVLIEIDATGEVRELKLRDTF
jgi:hypothetical protein